MVPVLPDYQRLLDKLLLRAKLRHVLRLLSLLPRNLSVRHISQGVRSAVLLTLIAGSLSCTDSDSSMNAAVIELAAVKSVTSGMLAGSRLIRQKAEPAYAWSFQDEYFWLERSEAASLPGELVQSIFEKNGETPWIRGKWNLSPDGSILTLREVSGANELIAAEATLPVGLAALMQITLAGEQYSIDTDSTPEIPLFKTGKPVAFKDRASTPPLWGFRDPANGATLIPAVYEKASDYSPQGIACVMDGGAPYIINTQGERLTQPLWIDGKPDSFREGRARCIGDDGKMGYFNAAGEIVLQGRWTYVEPFSGGLALVNNGGEWDGKGAVSGGLWGAINDLGQIVLKIDFSQLERGPGNTFRTSPEEPWFRPGSMSGE